MKWKEPATVIIYTTCRDCGGLLHVTNHDTVHPLCEPKPTRIERLTQEWLAAAEADDLEQEALLRKQIDEHDQRPPRLLEAALAYAQWGWPVFPLKPSSKQPATPHGFKNATTNPRHITAWWTKYPDANIGLPTGHAFDVIDIDVPDGLPTERILREQDGEVHGVVTTASGGTHYYVTPNGLGCLTRWQPGADYRGAGGYVVAPPSRIDPSHAWTWQHPPSPLITGRGDTHGIQ
jgi:Bifunctional DNA primase/polymerase, N-terminal